MNAKTVVENVRRIVSHLDVGYGVREMFEGLVAMIAEAVEDSDRLNVALDEQNGQLVVTIQDLRNDLDDARDTIGQLKAGEYPITSLQLRINELEGAGRSLRYEVQSLTEKLNWANERLSKFYMGNTDELETKVRAFMADNPGKKINAIKEVRSLTNWGLKESKEYVEYLDSHFSGHPLVV